MMEWWDEPTAGLIGSILGTLIGAGFGGVGGGVGGPLAAMGKANGFVLGIFATGCLLGVLLIVAGVVALALGQPYHVWFPLALPGVIGASVCGGLYPVMRRRYDEAERRRVEARDFGAAM